MATSVSDALGRAPSAARNSDRAFYTGIAIAAAAAVLVGFSRTFYLRTHFEPAALATVLRLHGIVFSSWMALFVVQTSLIAARRTATHRRLGWVGAALAGTMVVVGIVAAVFAGRRDIAAGYIDESLTFFATPVLSMAVFGFFVGTAIVFRGRPETHKRLMLLATVSILDAAIARWPISGISAPLAYYGLTDAFIAVAILYDFLSRRRVSPVYIWGGLLILTGQCLRGVLGATPAWHAFAGAILQ
jgi:MFS family permease